MSQNYFIAIGIGQYADDGPGALGECCKNDCGEIIKALERYDFKPLRYKYFKDPGKANAVPEIKDTILLDEEATLENITSLFDNLEYTDEFNPQIDEPANNLVIYYSGHGIAAPSFDSTSFYWVPIEYPHELDVAVRKQLYSWANQLLPSLGTIRFQHLIFINDSCFSAQGLTLGNLVPQKNQMPGSSREGQRSVWALCSSAANELSYAGRGNSVFTEYLVGLLLNHPNDQLPVSALADSLNRAKFNPEEDQNSFCERLNVINNNTGLFEFILNDTEKEKKAFEELNKVLKDGLPKYLNYTKERRTLKNLSDGTDNVLVFSNNKDSALPLMMRSARTEPLFKAYEKELAIIQEKAINHETDNLQKIFSFFNLTMGLKGPFSSKEELAKKVAAKLKARDYFIGILLNEQSRKNNNLDFVSGLLEIVHLTYKERKSGKHLYLFILDELLTDYTGLPLRNDANVVSKLVSDKISINSDDFDDWFGLHVQSITNNYNKHEYIKCFLKDGIYHKVKKSFNEERTPAFVITEICTNANCPGLAQILLTQIND